MSDRYPILSKLERIPADVVSLADYERLARNFMPAAVYEYVASGAADELTLHNNRLSFDRMRIYPRVLRDCSGGDTATFLLGQCLRHPILLAPVAHQKLVHKHGELATVEAADAMETGIVASTLSSVTLEDIAGHSGQLKWFQLYFQESRESTLNLVRRAEAAGYSAIVVTVDAPINGVRNRIQRCGFQIPEHARAANLKGNPILQPIALDAGQSVVFQGFMREAPSWQDIEWLRQQTQLPLIVKGVLHPDDAVRCVEHGASGVVVSNHGGRTLDSAPASIDALPIIRTAVGEDFTILLDGGVRRGSDVFKSIALGANAVLIGRPQLYALAVAGALGVAHMLRTLREELEITMALAGCPTLADIGPEAVFSDSAYILHRGEIDSAQK